jgi:tetratricopeptide (TPR) repeat protein
MFMSGDRTEATKLAMQILDKSPSPSIYCLLGDLQQDNSEKIKYFLKSIEFSNGKYAKAMRMVGKAYYNIKEYDKAVEYLEKALNINTLYPECWYILGCIYLIKKNFKQASLSFGKAAQINETDWQSWANLALSFNELGQPVQAMMAYEQSLKHSDNSERVAFNYVVIALTTCDFSRCYRGFSILLKESCSSIKPEMLARLCSITSKLEKSDSTRIVNIKKYGIKSAQIT